MMPSLTSLPPASALVDLGTRLEIIKLDRAIRQALMSGTSGVFRNGGRDFTHPA
jgi:hypothetical protein